MRRRNVTLWKGANLWNIDTLGLPMRNKNCIYEFEKQFSISKISWFFNNIHTTYLPTTYLIVPFPLNPSSIIPWISIVPPKIVKYIPYIKMKGQGILFKLAELLVIPEASTPVCHWDGRTVPSDLSLNYLKYPLKRTFMSPLGRAFVSYNIMWIYLCTCYVIKNYVAAYVEVGI